MSTPFESNYFNRRRFFRSAGASAFVMGAAGIAVSSTQTQAGWLGSSRSMLGKKSVILFQGDSITDAGWARDKGDQANNQAALGNGYAWLSAAELLIDRPNDRLKIYNRGISGHKVFQLAERWQKDCLDLKPDVLSILIGVNDYWHTLDGKYQGTVEIYERDFRALITRTRHALPKVNLIICEPFILKCGAVNDSWLPEFSRYQAAARRVAMAFQARFVPFQSIFDTATQFAPPAHWAADGVHPSSAGASLMAHHWLKAVTGQA